MERASAAGIVKGNSFVGGFFFDSRLKQRFTYK